MSYHGLVPVAEGEGGCQGDVRPGGVQAVRLEVRGGELVQMITCQFVAIHFREKIK